MIYELYPDKWGGFFNGGTFQLSPHYESHHIKIGFEYSKKIQKSYQFDPINLWTAMRGFTNFHLIDNQRIQLYLHFIHQ